MPKALKFLCHPEDKDVIPEPYPAGKAMPEWFKALPPKLAPGLDQSTLKRCIPFLETLTTGWIIPLAAEVEIKSNSDASGVDYRWNFHRAMIENHTKGQVTTDKCPAPHHNKPPMKWLNWWAIRCPPGYSLLFTPPLNGPKQPFTIFSGIVHADKYFEFINFPFIWDEPNFRGVIPAGTPLAQVIPIKRSLLGKPSISALTDRDVRDLEKTRARRRVQESYYRDHLWRLP